MNNEPKVARNEQKVMSNKQKLTSNERRVTSNEKQFHLNKNAQSTYGMMRTLFKCCVFRLLSM